MAFGAARQGWTNPPILLVAVGISAPPTTERIERSSVGLFVLVLLLVIMPGLLFLVGWGVKRYTDKAPSWIGFPTAPEKPSNKSDGEAPAKIEA
jgi:hypothetical protein